MSARRFLYITPYFPPMARVGAVRPLKFARHLPEFGWNPVVLCDLRRDDVTNGDLGEQVPESTTIVWDYGRHAADNRRDYLRGELCGPKTLPPSPPSLLQRLARAIPAAWVPDPEFLPLGMHGLDIPHALAASRRVLARHGCDAIVVNADPYAAMLVGARLAGETGLPLVQDLRDPWALCSLRRPRRLPPQRALVDRLERRAISAASAVVLNTERARADYVAHYADLPGSRFHTIRNHGDRELIGHGSPTLFDRFTMLFLGSFRRFVEGDVLLAALAELSRRGLSGDDLALVVSGDCPESTWDRARELGVADMLVRHPFVPYLQVGSFMAAADLLVSLSNDTEQRIPAKIYDYATTDRPILVIGDTRELIDLARALPGTRSCGRTDIPGIADAMQAEFTAGRARRVDRGESGLDSRTASRKLATILDSITSKWASAQPSSARDAK